MSALTRERLARAVLAAVMEPGDPRIARLVGELGAVTLVEGLIAQQELGGVYVDAAARLVDTDPERDLDRAERLGLRFVIPSDEEWPAQLDDLQHAEPLQGRGGPPLGLWVKGPTRLDQLERSVAVVGSRSATTYGAQVAFDVAGAVARDGFCLVSGAAFGIDQAAHRGALSVDGPTVAVLACGADRAYPAAHKSLLDHLGREGAVISEAPAGWAPTRIRFLGRNRLIAALTRGTVIVEAAVRSGALNTANWAGRLNRGLMAVPGPVTSAPSQGVHHLIRTGAATLVTSGAEVLELVGASGEHLLAEPREPEQPRDRLSTRQRQVLDGVPMSSGARIDSVARAAGIGLLEVSTTLRQLKEAGLVEVSDEGWRLAVLAHT